MIARETSGGAVAVPRYEFSGRAVAAVAAIAAVSLWATNGGLRDVPEFQSLVGDQLQLPQANRVAEPVLPCDSWAELPNVRQRVQSVIQKSAQTMIVDRGLAPGATIAVGCGDMLLATAEVGTTGNSLAISAETTRYDPASLGKHVTALGIMMLQQQGKLRLSDKASKYIPAYAQGDKAKVTLGMLLQHRSGLPSDDSSDSYDRILAGASSPAEVRRNIVTFPLTRSPGSKYAYSNVGFNVAAIAASKAAGMPLSSYLRTNLYRPLGMAHTGTAGDTGQCAPTSPDPRGKASRLKQVIANCVPQDRLARALGGSAGHISEPISAVDMGKLIGMEANKGVARGRRYVSQESLRQMATPQPDYPYGIGSRINATNRFSERMSQAAYGHTGHNMCVAMTDPATGLFSVMMMNGTFHRTAKPAAGYRAFSAITDGFVAAITPKSIPKT